MQCQHIDYDDYFERCGDCDMTGEEIHNTECRQLIAGTDWYIEEGMCSRCGTALNVEGVAL